MVSRLAASTSWGDRRIPSMFLYQLKPVVLLLVAFVYLNLPQNHFFLVPWLGICTRVVFCSVGCVELYRLRVDFIFQHPALVVVSAKTKLVLLVRVHRLVFHSETSVSSHVLVPIQSHLVSTP